MLTRNAPRVGGIVEATTNTYDQPRTGFFSVGHLTTASRRSAAGSSGSQTFNHDGAGKLFSVPGVFASATYEADGQTRQMVYANAVTTTFSYDPERRLETFPSIKNGSQRALSIIK